jgi:DHA1 family bicyclomycin/chloramphenicol resistance-like MFS transporter
MLVSSVVAGLVIPIIWGSLATLAVGMIVIFSLGLITITKTQAWKDEKLLLDE